jgi:hypothetical protein
VDDVSTSNNGIQSVGEDPIQSIPIENDLSQFNNNDRIDEATQPEDRIDSETKEWKRSRREDATRNAWSLGRPPKLPLRKARRRRGVTSDRSSGSSATEEKFFNEEFIWLSVNDDDSQIEISTVDEDVKEQTDPIKCDTKANDNQVASKLDIVQTYQDEEQGIIWVALQVPESMKMSSLEQNLTVHVTSVEKTYLPEGGVNGSKSQSSPGTASKSTVETSTIDSNQSVIRLKKFIDNAKQVQSLW